LSTHTGNCQKNADNLSKFFHDKGVLGLIINLGMRKFGHA